MFHKSTTNNSYSHHHSHFQLLYKCRSDVQATYNHGVLTLCWQPCCWQQYKCCYRVSSFYILTKTVKQHAWPDKFMIAMSDASPQLDLFQSKVNKACLNNRTPCVWQVFPSHVHQRIDKPTAAHSRHESCATQTLFQYWEFQTFASEQVTLGKINFCVKRKKNPDGEIRG